MKTVGRLMAEKIASDLEIEAKRLDAFCQMADMAHNVCPRGEEKNDSEALLALERMRISVLLRWAEIYRRFARGETVEADVERIKDSLRAVELN